MVKSKILVVEDEGIVAKDIQQTLIGLGYEVPAVASTGEDAVKKAIATLPDLVLMDVMLRGPLDGIGAAAQIRNTLKIPIVFLTAFSDDDTLHRAKVTEPFGYIVKPFQERDLYTAIEMALYKKGMDRKLEENRELLSVTLRSIGDGTIATDNSGMITFMNPLAEQLTGWTQIEAIGHPLNEVANIFLKEGTPAIRNLTAQALQNGQEFRLTDNTLLATRQGPNRPIDAILSPIKNAERKILGTVLVFKDITERKQADEERTRLLESEKKARAEAQDANRAKDVFLATLSHELKTPLTTVLAWSQMLRLRYLEPDKVKHAAEIIERNAKAQALLINDLLDISRIVMGKLTVEIEEVALTPILEAALDSLKPTLESKSIQIHLNTSISKDQIAVDPVRLQQILWNLLNNAAKFTPIGGEIWLRAADATLPQGSGTEAIEIEIKDSGQGIESQFLPQVFDLFSQGDSSMTRSHGGLGLGLAIVKGLVEKQHGVIQVDSAGTGKGSTFKVWLPSKKN